MPDIQHDLVVSATPQLAYQAVATQDGIRAWWAKNCQVGEAQGSKVELRFTKPDMTAVMNFEVTDLEPGKQVEWTCTKNSNPIWPGSKLSWRVEPAPEGSAVHFSHTGFSGGGAPYEMTVEGWQFYMGSLKSYLDGGKPEPSD